MIITNQLTKNLIGEENKFQKSYVYFKSQFNRQILNYYLLVHMNYFEKTNNKMINLKLEL